MDHNNQTPKGRPTGIPIPRIPRESTPPLVRAARRREAFGSRDGSAQPTTKRPHNLHDEDRAAKKLRIDTTTAGTPREARHWTPGVIARSKLVQDHVASVESTRKLASVAVPRTTSGAPLAVGAQPVNAGPSKNAIESAATSADATRRLSSGGGAGLSTMKGRSWAPLLQQQQQQQQQQQRPHPDHVQQQGQERMLTPTMSSSSSPLLQHGHPPPPPPQSALLGLAQPQPQPLQHDNVPKPPPSPFTTNPLGPAPVAANKGGYYNSLLFDTQRQQHHRTPSNSSTPNPSWGYNPSPQPQTQPHENLPPSVAEVLSPTRPVPSTSSTGTAYLQREDSGPAPGPVSGHYGPNGHYGHRHTSYAPNPYPNPNTQMVRGGGYFGALASTSRLAYMQQQGHGQSGAPIPADDVFRDDQSTRNDQTNKAEDNKQEQAKDSTPDEDKKGKKRARDMGEVTYELLVEIVKQNREMRAEITEFRRDNKDLRRQIADVSETLGIGVVSDSEDEHPEPLPEVAPAAASNSAVALPLRSSGADADAAIDVDAFPEVVPLATSAGPTPGEASGSGLAVQSTTKQRKRRRSRRTILERLESIEQDVAECTETLRDPEANLPPKDAAPGPSIGNVKADVNVPNTQVNVRTTREMGVRTSLPPASSPPPSSACNTVTFGSSDSSGTGVPASYPFTFNWPRGAIIDVRLPSTAQEDNDSQSKDNDGGSNTDSGNVDKPRIRVHGAGSMGDKFFEMVRTLLGDAHVELVQEADTDTHKDDGEIQSPGPVQASPEETESRDGDGASPEGEAERDIEVDMPVEMGDKAESEPESEIEDAKETGKDTNGAVDESGPVTSPKQSETHLEESSVDADRDIIMGDGNGGAANDNSAVPVAIMEAETVADQSKSEPTDAADLHDEKDHQMQTEQSEAQHHEVAQLEVAQDVVEPEQRLETVTAGQSQMVSPGVPQSESMHVEDDASPKVDTPPPSAKEASLTQAPPDPISHAIEKICAEVTVETESERAVNTSTTRDLSPPLSSAPSSPPFEKEDSPELSSASGGRGSANAETPNRDDDADDDDDDDGSDVQMDLSPEELAMITRQSKGIMSAVRTAESTSSGRASRSSATPLVPASIVETTPLPQSTLTLPASFDSRLGTLTPLSDELSTGPGEVMEDEISNWSDTQNEDRLGSAEDESVAPMSSTTASSSATLVSEAEAEPLTKIAAKTEAAHTPETIDASAVQDLPSLVPDVDDFAAAPVPEALTTASKTPVDAAKYAPAPSSLSKTPLSHGKIDLRTVQRRKTLMKLTFTPRIEDREDEADDTTMPKFTTNVDWSKTTPTKTSGIVTFTPTETRVLRSGRATPTRPGTPGATAGSKTPTRANASSSSSGMTPTAESVSVAANPANTRSSRLTMTPLILEKSKSSTSRLSPHEKAVRATAERAIEGLLHAQARSPDKDFSMPIGRKTPIPSPSKPPLKLPEILSTTTYQFRRPSEGTVASLRQQILGNNHMRSNITSKPGDQPSDQGTAASVHTEGSTHAAALAMPEVEHDVDMKVDMVDPTPQPVLPSPAAIVTEKAEAMDTSTLPASDAQESALEDVKVSLPPFSSTTPPGPLSQESSTAPPSTLTPLTSQPSVSAVDEEDVENQLVDAPPTSPARPDPVEMPEVDIELLSTPIASTNASAGRTKPRPKPRLSVTQAVEKPTPVPEPIYVESSPEKTPKKPLTRSTQRAQPSSRPTTRNATPLVQANSVISVGSSSDDAPPAPPSTRAKGKPWEPLAGATVKPEFNTISIRTSTPKQPVQTPESTNAAEVNPLSKSSSKSFNLAKSIRDMSPLSDIPDDPPTPAPAFTHKAKGKRVLEPEKYTKKLSLPNTTADSDDEGHFIVKKRRIPSSSSAAAADAEAGTTTGPRKTSLLLPAKKGQSAAATRVVRKRKATMDPDAEENMPPLKRAAIRAASRALESKDVASASTPNPTSSSTTAVQSGSRSGSEPNKEKQALPKKPARSTPSKRVKVELLSESGRTPTRVRPARTTTVGWPPIPDPNLVQSIECDLCHLWYHWGCAGIDAHDPRLQPSEIYKCPPCEEGVTGNGSPKKNTNNSRKCARPKCPTLREESKQGSRRKKSKEYEVESFVGKCKRMIDENSSGEIQFLVKWVDYPFEANTWETLEQLNLSNHQIFIKALEQGASKEGIILEEEQLKWNEPVYLSEAVKAGWGPDGKFTKP